MSVATMVATKTIVVADDTAFVRDRFKVALEAAGHRVLPVRTASELLALVRAQRAEIHLIVIDLRLPQGQGVGLVKDLRRLPGELPPIVVFSGTIANTDEVRELAGLKVAGYVNEYTASQHIMPSLAPHMFPDVFSCRSSPRVALGVPVSYRFGNTIAAALTFNISTGGLAVRTTSPLDVGTMIRVRFRLRGAPKEIDAEARVAWTDRRIGMGLQFTKISTGDQTAIHDFVQAHFFSNRKA